VEAVRSKWVEVQVHGEFDRDDDGVRDALAEVMVFALTTFGDLNQSRGLEAPVVASIHWSTPEQEEALSDQAQATLDRLKAYTPS